jgi:hypothetical protein
LLFSALTMYHRGNKLTRDFAKAKHQLKQKRLVLKQADSRKIEVPY